MRTSKTDAMLTQLEVAPTMEKQNRNTEGTEKSWRTQRKREPKEGVA
jgi:hypothetical protein